MPVEGLDGGHQVELLNEYRREAVGQEAHQVVGSPDVGVRESNGAHVGGLHVQSPSQAYPSGHQAGVGVQHTLGVRRGARRVVDPADDVPTVGRHGRNGREGRRVTLGKARRGVDHGGRHI